MAEEFEGMAAWSAKRTLAGRFAGMSQVASQGNGSTCSLGTLGTTSKVHSWYTSHCSELSLTCGILPRTLLALGHAHWVMFVPHFPITLGQGVSASAVVTFGAS